MFSDFKNRLFLFTGLILSSPLLGQSTCDQIADLLKSGQLLEAEKIISDDLPCPNLTGQLFLRKGDNDKAEKYFEIALDQAESDKLLRAEALNNLGLVYWNTGNVSKGTQFIEEALEIRTTELGEMHELIAASYNDLGLILSGIDLERALSYYEKALNIYQDVLGKENERTVQASINTGIIYRQLEYYGEATLAFDEALATWKKLHPNGHPNEAFILTNIGQNKYALGFADEALTAYKNALKVYVQFYGEKHPEVASTYNLIGNIYNAQGEFEIALDYYQKAIIANVPDFKETELKENPKVADYLNANTFLNSLYYKSKALMDLHFNKTLRFSDLKLSLATLQSCDSLIDNIRKTRTNETDKLSLGQLSTTVYDTGVELCKAMGDVVANKDLYYELSFYFAEKSKSAVLLEAITDAKAKSFAGLEESDLLLEKAFKNDIAYLESQIALQSNSDFKKSLQSELLVKRQAYESFIQTIEKKYPKYFDLKYNNQLPTVNDIQKLLSSNQVILSYFLTENSKRIYIYEITNKRFKLYSKPQGDMFDQFISGFKNSIFFKVKDTYELTAVELNKLLVPKQRDKNVDHIIIIPAGRLGTMPFEALLTSKLKGNVSYNQLPYLINDYKISYTYSSALLNETDAHDQQNEAFLCAPIIFEDLPNLPGTKEELEKLDALLGEKNIISKSLYESEASEEVIKYEDFSGYRYVHLATHGIVDEEVPELSRIFLNPGGNEDGSLYTGEIYNLKLDTELVTLSACETGLGKLSKGEGVIGLSRALLYAGASNVVVSLWAVSDRSTSDLMTNFYGNFINNEYSQPLRNAKQSLINSNEYAEPFYWAPFILIGQ